MTGDSGLRHHPLVSGSFRHSSPQPISLWTFLLLDLATMVVGETSDSGIQVPDSLLILPEKGPGVLQAWAPQALNTPLSISGK